MCCLFITRREVIKLPWQICRGSNLYRRQATDYFLLESPRSDLLRASDCLMTAHSEAMLNSAKYKPILE